MEHDPDNPPRPWQPSAFLGCLVVLLLATLWLTLHIVIRAPISTKPGPAEEVLRSLHAVERQYRDDKGTYASLTTLKAEGLFPTGEGEADPNSGYTFATEVAEKYHYTIVATPPASDLDTWTLNETGILTRQRPKADTSGE